MLPVSVAASTSPSLANVPPVIDTVALTSLRLSGSETASVGEIVVADDGETVSDEATFESVGASLTLVMVTVVVCAVLVSNEADPSLSTQVTVRVVLDPKLVGFSPAEKVTLSSTV